MKLKRWQKMVLVLPSLLGITIFYVIPFIVASVYAFWDSPITKNFVGIENFRFLFANEYFVLAMKNTLKFMICAVPLSMLLAVVIAFLLLKVIGKFPMFVNLFFLPYILPSAVIVLLVNAFNPVETSGAFLSLLIVFLWKYTGISVILLLVSLIGFDDDIINAAKIDGAAGGRIIRSIILPNLSPALFLVLILSVINSLKIFRESYLLYGYYPDEKIYMMQNFLNNQFWKLDYQNVSAAAIVFFLLIYGIISVLFILEWKWSDTM